jgi:outer membrane lipoprotein LolB
MRQAQPAATLLLTLLLAACASAPAVMPVDWEQQQARLAALDHFTASGKIALRSADQAESGSLLWQQAGRATHIRLAGPMGLAATTVDSDGEVLELRQGEEYSRWRLDDPAIAPDSTWDIPLGALVYWLKGMPAPGLAVEALQFGPQDGLPVMLRQDGWTILYGDFASFQGYMLPTRLDASRQDSSARIIVREWRDLSAHDHQP